MQVLKNIKKNQEKIDYSSVLVAYKVKDGVWRGFVHPFDITYESATKKEVVSVLKDMLDAYVDGLHRYGNPAHLSNVPLSHTSDSAKWQRISIDLMSKLQAGIPKVVTKDYYAEAQLPA